MPSERIDEEDLQVGGCVTFALIGIACVAVAVCIGMFAGAKWGALYMAACLVALAVRARRVLKEQRAQFMAQDGEGE